jgi:hypothetical protein
MNVPFAGMAHGAGEKAQQQVTSDVHKQVEAAMTVNDQAASQSARKEAVKANDQAVASGGGGKEPDDDDDDPKKRLRDEKGRYKSDPDNSPSENKYTSSDRRADWKKEAENPTRDDFTDEDMERMRKGLPPRRFNPDKGGVESMERSHEPTPRRDGGTETVPKWPQEHAEVDEDRYPGY